MQLDRATADRSSAPCNRYDSEHWWLKEDNVPVTVTAGGFVTEVQALTPFVENRDPNNMNEYLQVRFGINVQDYIHPRFCRTFPIANRLLQKK